MLLSAGLGVALLGLCLVALEVVRIAAFGWGRVAPDDAQYVYVGLSTLAGDGPRTPGGNVFLLRSPVYGLALAAGGRLFGNPIDGARVVALALSLAALVEAIWLAWRLGGMPASIGTSVALLASPLVWRLLPTMRIDLPQTAGVLAVLIALLDPTVRRGVIGGAMLGVTVLVKEVVLLLAVLPIATIGFIPARRTGIVWLSYLAAAVIVAGWWWLVVWVRAGVIFPANALAVIDQREVIASPETTPFEIIAAIVMVLAWFVVALRARRQYPARLLLVAAACLVPPAAYAALNGLNERNSAGLVVLSSVAIGVAAAELAERVRARRGGAPSQWAAAGVAIVAGVAAIVLGQQATDRHHAGRRCPSRSRSGLGRRGRQIAGSSCPSATATSSQSSCSATAQSDSSRLPASSPAIRWRSTSGSDSVTDSCSASDALSGARFWAIHPRPSSSSPARIR